QTLIYQNPVKPGFYGILISDLSVMLQRLAHCILNRIQSIFPILNITVCQPVKLVLIFNNICSNMIIQVFLHPNFLSALFFSFYLIDCPESEKVAEKTNFNKRQINFLLARKQKRTYSLFSEK